MDLHADASLACRCVCPCFLLRLGLRDRVSPRVYQNVRHYYDWTPHHLPLPGDGLASIPPLCEETGRDLQADASLVPRCVRQCDALFGVMPADTPTREPPGMAWFWLNHTTTRKDGPRPASRRIPCAQVLKLVLSLAFGGVLWVSPGVARLPP
jgi:hypothetical protein